jgi:hypothetical protein
MLKQDGSRVWVTLTLSEMLHCGNVGIIRHYEAEIANRQTDKKFEMTQKSLIGAHVEGAMGEMVVAKARGKYFMPTVNNFKEADLGANVQVRLRMFHHWDLIIRDNDNPEHIYVLVTGTGPEFCIRGWCHAKDVMLPEYRKNHGGSGEAWFIPESALKPMKIKD